jgi:carboxymethylenebutenolidase
MHDEFSTPRTKEEKIEHLVHLYVDGAFPRRELVRKLSRYLGGAAAATALLNERGLAQAPAACPANIRIPLDAMDVTAEDIQIGGKAGPLYVHLAKPNPLTEAQPAVLVLHENRGLVEHIKDVTRRVARAGFIGLGLDLLSRQGGTQAFDNDTARAAAYGRTTQPERNEDMLSAIDYLKSEGFVIPERIGAVGFCAGGGNILNLIFQTRDLYAGVPYYGTPPNPLPSTENVNTRLLFILSETDRNQNSRYPALMTDLIARQKTFGMHLYQGTGHGFHNDTGAVYNPTAACDAWAKTIEFFNRHLRAPV